MRTGYNPTRRNRNIGTANQGFGQDNEMVIPESLRDARLAQHTIGKFKKFERQLAGRTLTFFVEENSGGCTHSCSVSDVCKMFENIPFADWMYLETIVLWQPTRKQRIIKPVWGRLSYHAEVGQKVGKQLADGPTIFLEAMSTETQFSWSTSLSPEWAQELERLKEDGHTVERVGKKHVIRTNEKAVRQTQLFRTLIHEVGHWVDYLEKVERPSEKGEESYEALEDQYFSRPKQEREAFAHRYADMLSQKLKTMGIIPFDRIED